MINDWKNRAGRTYLDMVLEFGKQTGIGNNYPVISRREHPTEWAQWLAYYSFRKLRFQLDQMNERSTQTVPCLSPIDFDPEYRQPGLGTGQDQRFGGL